MLLSFFPKFFPLEPYLSNLTDDRPFLHLLTLTDDRPSLAINAHIHIKVCDEKMASRTMESIDIINPRAFCGCGRAMLSLSEG